MPSLWGCSVALTVSLSWPAQSVFSRCFIQSAHSMPDVAPEGPCKEGVTQTLCPQYVTVLAQETYIFCIGIRRCQTEAPVSKQNIGAQIFVHNPSTTSLAEESSYDAECLRKGRELSIQHEFFPVGPTLAVGHLWPETAVNDAQTHGRERWRELEAQRIDLAGRQARIRRRIGGGQPEGHRAVTVEVAQHAGIQAARSPR